MRSKEMQWNEQLLRALVYIPGSRTFYDISRTAFNVNYTENKVLDTLNLVFSHY